MLRSRLSRVWNGSCISFICQHLHKLPVSQTSSSLQIFKRCAHNSRKGSNISVSGQLGLSAISDGSSPELNKRAWQIPDGISQSLRKDTLQQMAYLKTVVMMRHTWAEKGTNPLMERLAESESHEETTALLSTSETSDLLEIMTHLTSLDNPMRLSKMIHLIEKEICNKIKEFQLTQLLYIADVLFTINFLPNQYYKVLFRYLDHHWERFDPTPQNIVQLMFYIAMARDAPISLLSNIERYFANNMHALNVSEVSLICFAFFVTNKSIRNVKLLDQIANKTLEGAATMKLHLLANNFKALRHGHYEKTSFYEKVGDIMKDRQDLLTPDRVSISPFMHIVSTFASVRFKHPELLEAINQGLRHIILVQGKETRAKDLIRLMWSYGMLRSPMRYDVIAHIMQRSLSDPTFQKRFPESMVEGLTALTLQGIYPENLISICFSPEYQTIRANRYLSMQDQQLLLDKAVELFCPYYTGNRASPEMVSSMERYHDKKILQQLSFRIGLRATWWSLQELLSNPALVSCHYILPFSKIPDIEIHINKNGTPVKFLTEEEGWKQSKNKIKVSEKETHSDDRGGGIMEQLLEKSFDMSIMERTVPENLLIEPVIKPEIKKIAIKLLSWNQYLRNTPELHGLVQKEVEFLREMNYYVLLINPKDGKDLHSMSEAARKSYLSTNVLKRLGIKVARD